MNFNNRKNYAFLCFGVGNTCVIFYVYTNEKIYRTELTIAINIFSSMSYA